MIFCKLGILLCVFLLFSVFSADCRRIEHRGYNKRHTTKHTYRRTPVLRQLESDTITGTATDSDPDIDNGTGSMTGTGNGMDIGTVTGANPVAMPSKKPTKGLVLIKPRQAGGSSRLFGGFFLNALLAPGGSFGGGGVGGGVNGLSSIPYIIVNVPNNVTNINQNSLNNTADADSTTTTTPPPTRLLYQAPFPEQIYQRRGINSADQAHNFILSPGNQLFPVYLPPEVENLVQGNIIRSGGDQRRRVQANQNNNNNRFRQNPFSAFANNLMRVQYG